MATKDKYDNNLRRGMRVKDLSDSEHGEGEVIGTHGKYALVYFDDLNLEVRIEGHRLVAVGKAFR